MSASPSILIVGTGALACLFAARFSAVGIAVTMLGTWQEGVTALQSQGVTLIEADGSEHNYPVRVAANPKECQDQELALVLVKSWQTERVAGQLQKCLPPKSLVLTLQNGLGNRQKLAYVLGEDRVFQGITTIGGNLLAPGRVRCGGEGLISIGSDSKLNSFTEVFQQAKFKLEKVPEIVTLIWGKLAINAAINPLTAILGVPNGFLISNPQTRELMAMAAREVAAIAAMKGIQLPFDDVVEATETVARRTAHNHSSMLQDMKRGAPTEIEAINGAVIQAAEQVRIPAPVNRVLYLVVKSVVNKRDFNDETSEYI